MPIGGTELAEPERSASARQARPRIRIVLVLTRHLSANGRHRSSRSGLVSTRGARGGRRRPPSSGRWAAAARACPGRAGVHRPGSHATHARHRSARSAGPGCRLPSPPARAHIQTRTHERTCSLAFSLTRPAGCCRLLWGRTRTRATHTAHGWSDKAARIATTQSTRRQRHAPARLAIARRSRLSRRARPRPSPTLEPYTHATSTQHTFSASARARANASRTPPAHVGGSVGVDRPGAREPHAPPAPSHAHPALVVRRMGLGSLTAPGQPTIGRPRVVLTAPPPRIPRRCPPARVRNVGKLRTAQTR
jgi:hypothetical protein